MEKTRKISKQIAVYKNNKGLLEMQNCLKQAPKETPWHIHAEGKEEGYSLIRLVIVDYSKGTGENSVSAYANLKPEEIKYLYMRLCMGFEQVTFQQQKIYNDREKGGIVTILKIERNEYRSDGEKSKFPWTVYIQNGTGKVAYNGNGGQFCQKGTYKEQQKVQIFLDDIDFFRLLSRACAVIEAFEKKALYREQDVQNFQTLYRLVKKEFDTAFGNGMQGGKTKQEDAA